MRERREKEREKETTKNRKKERKKEISHLYLISRIGYGYNSYRDRKKEIKKKEESKKQRKRAADSNVYFPIVF